jgi:hypothetical protein
MQVKREASRCDLIRGIMGRENNGGRKVLPLRFLSTSEGEQVYDNETHARPPRL